MRQPTPGDLFACRWERHEPHEQDSFRLIEVAVGPEDIDVFAYGDRFASPPAEADVTKLRPIGLHKWLDGPARVSRREFAMWALTPVRRVDVAG